VTLAAPDGTPLNVVNGNLASVQVAPAVPVHVQGQFAPGPQGGSITYNLLQGLSKNAIISISSITVTCVFCFQNSQGTAAQYYDSVTVFSNNASDCSGSTSGTAAQVLATSTEPSVEFTYPARVVPVGFIPSGPWCLGMTFYSASVPSPVFVSIDGAQGYDPKGPGETCYPTITAN